MGVHTGTTWQTQLNNLCLEIMQVDDIITMSTH